MTRLLAWGLWAATMLSLALLVPVSVVDPTSFSGAGSVFVAVAVIAFIVTFATVGLVVTLRRPRNPIGWILGAAGLAYGVASLGSAWANYAFLVKHGTPAGARTAAWLSDWVWSLALGPSAVLPLLLFPDGRLPSPRWRPVLWMASVAVFLMAGGSALYPGRFEDYPATNAVGIDGAASVLNFLGDLGVVLLIVAFVAIVVSLVRRFRRSRGHARQQLKWLTYSAGVIAVGGLASTVVEPMSTDTSNALVTIALMAYPIALGAAMLRHRLYDIDVVINRTLVYAALTATLAAIYVGSVLLLQLALGPVTSGSSLAVAVSTLAVAALFRPARARIQALVDRRFYRSKYDAARTLEDFSARLREQVDLEALGGELRSVVSDTMQPAHVSLWLRAPGARR